MYKISDIYFNAVSYLHPVIKIENFSHTVKDMVAAIKKFAPEAEGIAFRGASGALVAMPICEKLQMLPMMVRKPNDGSHSGKQLEGGYCHSFIIVDDLVDTGTTVQSILSTIDKVYGGSNYKCLGVFCYYYNWNDGTPQKSIEDYRTGDEIQVYGTDGAAKSNKKRDIK